MRGYSELEVFHPDHLKALSIAQRVVALMPTTLFGEKVRCHEMTRIVSRFLTGMSGLSIRVHVVDGSYLHVEHSWLELVTLYPQANISGAILDVYAVGILPQVLLVDPSVNANQYLRREPRCDILHRLVEHAVQVVQARSLDESLGEELRVCPAGKNTE